MTVPRRVSWSRYGYVVSSGLFAVGVIVQMYIAGMAVFVDPANWSLHRGFVHFIELFLLPMLVFAFLGTLPRTLKLIPVGLFLLIALQYATASMFGSAVAAIHPVNAVLIFLMAIVASQRAWTLATQTDPPS